MELKEIEKRIDGLKEISPDERMKLTDALVQVVADVESLLEKLAAIPDETPPEGRPNPRDEFVDNLMRQAGVGNANKQGR